MAELIKLPKRVTWTSKIKDLKVGDEPLKADYSELNTICSLISGRLKFKYPNMVFETYKDVEGDQEFLRVKRIK